MVLSWEGELSKKEMPPEWMWPLSWELKRWMSRVAAERRSKYGGDDDDASDDEYEGDGWEKNEWLPEWAQ
jgi:hypothetical protein